MSSRCPTTRWVRLGLHVWLMSCEAIARRSTCGLVAMTHAEGRQFDPGQVYITWRCCYSSPLNAKSIDLRWLLCWLSCEYYLHLREHGFGLLHIGKQCSGAIVYFAHMHGSIVVHVLKAWMWTIFGDKVFLCSRPVGPTLWPAARCASRRATRGPVA